MQRTNDSLAGLARFLIAPSIALSLVTGCAGRQPRDEASAPPDRTGRTAGRSTGAVAPAAPLPGAPLPAPAEPDQQRPLSASGPVGASSPPPSVGPPPRPLPAADMQSLGVLYQRPAPMGPPPQQRETPRAIVVVGKGPIFSQLPGTPAYANRYPAELLKAEGGKDLFSNEHNVQLSEGKVRFVAFDRTVNDSRDSMAFEASFTGHEGAVAGILRAYGLPEPRDPEPSDPAATPDDTKPAPT